MSSEQERSFIARISIDDSPIVSCGRLSSPNFYAHTSIDDDEAGNWSMSASTSVQQEPDNLLTTLHGDNGYGMFRRRQTWDRRTRRRIDEMVVYFRCYEDYYNIQIRSEDYFGNFFSKNSDGLLAALPPAGGNTTSFNLLNADHQTITLDNLTINQATVHLKARSAGMINRQLMRDPTIYTYGDKPGDSVRFHLEILERDVPYPTSSKPMTRYLEPELPPHTETGITVSAGMPNNKAYLKID